MKYSYITDIARACLWLERQMIMKTGDSYDLLQESAARFQVLASDVEAAYKESQEVREQYQMKIEELCK